MPFRKARNSPSWPARRKAIEPAQANLNSDTTIRVIVVLAIMGLAVAVVVLAWRRSRRQTSPAT